METASNWNQSGADFDNTDVLNLSNSPSQAPVVWMFSNFATDLYYNQSAGEQWMKRINAGVSSVYGATDVTMINQNYALNEWMFRAVYDEGLKTQSHAIMWSEDKMATYTGDYNAWIYLLLGDPDIKVRTQNPKELNIRIPEFVATCKFCDLPIHVEDELGNPVENALVGLWKPFAQNLPNTQGETWVNGYTNSEGMITLPYSALSEGELFYSVEDEAGNSVFNNIQVVR
jgi:hypothetical protein